MFGRKSVGSLVCPLLQKGCIKEKCMFWTTVKGKHPQTGEDLNFPDCTVRWLPVLLLKQSQETGQLAAATESARNEAKKDAAGIAGALIEAAKHMANSNPLRINGPQE